PSDSGRQCVRSDAQRAMIQPSSAPALAARLERTDLQSLLDALREQGYTVLGPTIHEGTVVYAELERVAQLPAGRRDEQGPGRYRLEEGTDGAYFGFALGPHSWKQFLFPP